MQKGQVTKWELSSGSYTESHARQKRILSGISNYLFCHKTSGNKVFSLYSLCQFPNLCPSVWIIKKSRWYSQCFLQQLSTQLSRIKNLSSHIYTKYHILSFLILFYLVISKAELSNFLAIFGQNLT